MKGIGHFLTGMAVATCFPEAMRATVGENSLMLLLGGAFGLLPDTLDFRVGRYLWKHHRTVTPDLANLDARVVANAVAAAIDEAATTGKRVHLKLHTLKVSANYHRTYSIRIDEEARTVTAKIGPLKTMGQAMGGGGSLPRSIPDLPPEQLQAVASFSANVDNPYHAETTVAIFSGPDFAFVPDNGKIRVDFIPWHRTWAHSPFLGLVCGLLGWLVYGLIGLSTTGDPASFFSARTLTVFGIITLAFWAHTLVDQFGVLGSELLWPFSGRRSAGFGWTHAASIMGNITLNIVCVAVMIWNCVVFSPDVKVVMPWAAGLSVQSFSDPLFYVVSALNYLVYWILAPLAVLFGGVALYGRLVPRRRPASEEVALQDAAKAEEEEGLDGPGEFSGD